MSSVKSNKRISMIRLPDDLAEWLAERATRNGGTISTEVARHFRQVMDAETARTERTSAGE